MGLACGSVSSPGSWGLNRGGSLGQGDSGVVLVVPMVALLALSQVEGQLLWWRRSCGQRSLQGLALGEVVVVWRAVGWPGF